MILFAIPVHRAISAPTYSTIINLFNRFPDAQQRMVAGYAHPDLAHADLMALFLSSPADHVLFVGEDVAFEPRVVEDLLAADLPVVAAPYREAMPPQAWTCHPEAGVPDLGSAPQRIAGDGRRVLRMARSGLGCTLVRRDAADAVHRHFRDALRFQSRITQLEAVSVFSTLLREDADGIRRALTEEASFYARLAEVGVRCDVLWDAQIMHGGIVSNLATVVPAAVADASKLS